MKYVAIAGDRYNSGTDWGVVLGQQVSKLSAFGEVAANLRAEQFATRYRPEFVLLGCLAAVLVAGGWLSRVRSLKPVDVYFAAYAAIIFVYPFFTYGAGRRFLFPVLPLAIAYACIGAGRLTARIPRAGKWCRLAASVYLTAFVTVALTGLRGLP